MSGNVPHPTEKDPIRLSRSIRDLFEGRSNAFGTITLTLNQATTTVLHPNVGDESTIHFSPRHANAAAEIGNGTMYIAAGAITVGQFVITHANSATANRTFDYAIIG